MNVPKGLIQLTGVRPAHSKVLVFATHSGTLTRFCTCLCQPHLLLTANKLPIVAAGFGFCLRLLTLRAFSTLLSRY